MFNALLGCYAGALAGASWHKNDGVPSDTEIWGEPIKLNQDAVTSVAMGTVCAEIYADDPKLEQSDDELKARITKRFQQLCRQIKDVKYTDHFKDWLESESPLPYRSLGAGAALRAVAPAMLFMSLESSLRMTKLCVEITHSHPKGINGALAMAFLLKGIHLKAKMADIKSFLSKHFSFDMDRDLDSWQQEPPQKASCEECIPAAMAALQASTTFNEAIQNALSINGPRVTAALTGALAMAFYHKDEALKNGGKDGGMQWAVAVLTSMSSQEKIELCHGIIEIPKIKSEESSASPKTFLLDMLQSKLDVLNCLDDTTSSDVLKIMV